MTTDQEVAEAWAGAAWAARRDNGRSEPAEWVGAAWERVRATGRTGVAGLAALDALRTARGWRNATGVTLFCDLDPDEAFDPPAPAPADPPERRLLAAWCAARPDRAGQCPRVRLWAYLVYVEGWPQVEVSAVWGLGATAVGMALRRAGYRLYAVG